MKKVLITAMMLTFAGSLKAQDAFHTKQVQVLPSSELSITGDTNINSFECVFDTSYLKELQAVSYLLNQSTIDFQGAKLTLETRGFDCGSKPINRDFNELIKADKYPQIFLELNRVELISPTKGIASVYITIAGKQKLYDIPINIEKGEISHLQGKLELSINDFGLVPPKKLFGMIVVKDDIQISFNLKVKGLK